MYRNQNKLTTANMEQNNIKENVVDLINDLKEYANTRSTLLSFQIKKIAAELLANIGSSLIILVFSALVFLFGSFAFAYYISEKYNSIFIGFASVTGIYFILLVIALLLKNTIKTYFSNAIIRILFKEEEEHENN